MITLAFTIACMIAVATWLRWQYGRVWVGDGPSESPVDGWTLTHLGWGMVLYGGAQLAWPGMDRQIAVGIVVAIGTVWEFVENADWAIRLIHSRDGEYEGDSAANAALDVLAVWAGAAVTSLFI